MSLRRGVRLLGTWALFVQGALACGGGAEPLRPVAGLSNAAPSSSAGEQSSPEVILKPQFSFADEREAEGALPLRVAGALVGEQWLKVTPSWKPVLPAGVTRLGRHSKGVTVTAQLDAQLVARWLGEFERAPLEFLGPAQWREAWAQALQTERARWLCRRRFELLKVPCAATGQPAQSDAAELLPALAAKVVLEPNLPDGVPVDAQGALLWPPRIRVWQRTEEGLEALVGLPLAVVGESGGNAAQTTVLSDASGNSELKLPTGFGKVRVAAFGPGTLGPLQSYWPAVGAELQTRELQRTRCVLVVHDVAEPSFQRTAQAALRSARGQEPVTLPEHLAKEVALSEERALSAALVSKIVEATQGQTDYLAKVSVESEFASQMGSGRVWYEARAQVKVFELWTGKVVDVFEVTATESGVGDTGADVAARERLGTLVAARLTKP
jgi:hypothetical protein